MSEEDTTLVSEGSGPSQDRATFYGVHFRDVTGHKQVAIPKAFQNTLVAAQEGPLLLMRWQKEPFLRLFTKKQFDRKLDEVKAKKDWSVEQRAAATAWMARSAEPIEPDKQGRFVLPSKHIVDLGIRERVAFCGAFSYIELWPAETCPAKEAVEPAGMAEMGKELTNVLNM
jgi:DNA-binding transcriptional regulator/RsmH inhibitor MraZ